MWDYNWNIDYSKYYNNNVIVCVCFDISDQEKEIQYSYGKFIQITKPKITTNYESTVIVITNDDVLNSITTNVIKFIKIDISDTTKKNCQLLRKFIVKNTNNDIYNQIYEYLTQDYIDI